MQTSKLTPRQRHEKMLIYVCGMNPESLSKMSDEEVKKLFERHQKMM